MTDDRITPNPLDPGDEFEIDVQVHDRVDVVLITVPTGKGTVFAHWLHRYLGETPELRAGRRAADLLAELKAAA